MQRAQQQLTFFEWRERLGLTQREAGTALDRTWRCVQNYERPGVEIPHVVRLAMLYLLEHPEAIDRTRFL
ncbi:MAG TPA: hypothetical protein VEQ62_06030 [Stellaceae bacterium]|jgi:hypothetical protein|nr:hypothetical protein [Stellaceae bacterium]